MGKIEQQLRKIPRKERERIFRTLDTIYRREFTGLDRKKLKGFDHIFRIRVGTYRIVYEDNGTSIILKGILKRNESTYRHT